MRTLVSSLVAAAFVLAVGTSQASASDKMMMKCPKGSTYVSGHMDKMSHKMTKGYCRKKPMMSMKKM
jgi:hypothetical protein